MHKFIPAFELKDSVLKKALSFSGIATLGLVQSSDIATDEPASVSNDVEEIIVTASKRESKIEDLPMSVQAIAGSRLESANVNDFMDYAELIPSLSYIQTPQLQCI
jgi:iron complex outermembrane receptor protein